MAASSVVALMAAFLPFLVISQMDQVDVSLFSERRTNAHLNLPIQKPATYQALSGIEKSVRERLSEQHWGLGDYNQDYIPSDCAYFAKKVGAKPEDMMVRNVSYGDCPDSWIMCLHKDLRWDGDVYYWTFGRVPIHLRSWVKHVVAFPQAFQPKKREYRLAFEEYGNLVFYEHNLLLYYGKKGRKTLRRLRQKELLDLMLHEVGHSLDFNGAWTRAVSTSETWQRAQEADNEVPTRRAQRNTYENVAENFAIAAYFHDYGNTKMKPFKPREDDRLNPPEGEDWHDEMKKDYDKKQEKTPWQYQQDFLAQLGRPRSRGGKSMFDRGGACIKRIPPSKLIPKKAGGGTHDEAPVVTLSPGIKAIKVAAVGTGKPYVCHLE